MTIIDIPCWIWRAAAEEIEDFNCSCRQTWKRRMDFYCWQLGLMEGDAKTIATIPLINLVQGRKYSPLPNKSHLKLHKQKNLQRNAFKNSNELTVTHFKTVVLVDCMFAEFRIRDDSMLLKFKFLRVGTWVNQSAWNSAYKHIVSLTSIWVSHLLIV